MLFRLHAYRFRFIARAPVHFPPGKAGNVFRGALGLQFRAVACDSQCPGASQCPECPYARLFEPHLSNGPSGLADPPRPFVLRASHLDGLTLASGDRFTLDIHLFDLRAPAAAYFALAFTRLLDSGLGPGRGAVELATVEAGATPLFQNGQFLDTPHPEPVAIDLSTAHPGVGRVRIDFHTPTELKEHGAPVREPSFAVLFARLRDRVANLRALYGDGLLENIDFKGLAERASAIRTEALHLRDEAVERRSSRTGQRHPLGGFTGHAIYAGDLAEFAPWLLAGAWTGIGRQTVWGKGAIGVSFEHKNRMVSDAASAS